MLALIPQVRPGLCIALLMWHEWEWAHLLPAWTLTFPMPPPLAWQSPVQSVNVWRAQLVSVWRVVEVDLRRKWVVWLWWINVIVCLLVLLLALFEDFRWAEFLGLLEEQDGAVVGVFCPLPSGPASSPLSMHTSGSSSVIEWEWLVIFYLMNVSPPPILLMLS